MPPEKIIEEYKYLLRISFNSYLQAEHYFKSALEKIKKINEDILADKWEPLLNNLGHVCRKLK